MKLYNQELQKAIDDREKVKQEFMIEVNKSDTDFPHNVQVEKEIMESLPKSLKVKGQLLLDRLKANNVNWNPAGELIVSTTKYDGTNIIDLVNDVIQNRKYSAPFGWQIFADQLAKMNAPQEMIINKSRWNYIMKHKNISIDVNSAPTITNEITSWENY